MTPRKQICFVVSAPGTAISFLRDHIAALSKKYDVSLVANIQSDSDMNRLKSALPDIKEFHHVAIERGISLVADSAALARLTSYLRSRKFDAVHSVTPKAGLLTAMAAKAAGITHRIHIFTGQVWATRSGAMRSMLKSMDKLIATLDNYILVDGESQRQFLIAEGVVDNAKSQVLGAGSICGANTDRFTPIEGERERQRRALGILEEKVVVCFMGRLNRDKGIYELLAAVNELAPECEDIYLLLFGYDEEGCMAHMAEYPNLKHGENFQFYGATTTPQLSLQAADISCLPSYREGFGMSVIEASCLGLPVICSDAYGLADTMVDEVTGLRCKVADVATLKQAIKLLYDNSDERHRMGQNGRERVLDLFPGEKIVGAWIDFYSRMLD